jgi:hypothetical protein
MGKTRRAVALLSDRRFVDLAANLQYFEQRYASYAGKAGP